MEELYLLDRLGLVHLGMGWSSIQLEELDISPQDFEPEENDFNNSADEFGFYCQMNWKNSIGNV